MPKIVINMPKIGESTQVATILNWYKKEGDSVTKDEILVEISTDKVNSELPSEYEGVLTQIFVKENEQALVNQAIAEMEVSHEIAEQLTNNESNKQEIPQEISVAKSNLWQEKIYNNSFLSPIVRKLIQEFHISFEELSTIKPLQGNRISKKDILFYIESKKPKTVASVAQLESKLNLTITENDTVKSLSPLRKRIAENLQQSYQIIPHVTTFSEINVSNLVIYRESIKEAFHQKHQQKITYTHLLMYCVIKSLQAFPQLNAWMNVDELIRKGNINLGFATALPDGNLIVPNVKKVEHLSLENLVQQVNITAQKAKENKLSTEDIQETTFTVSNTGIFGSLMGTPIIVKPQVAVLALGEIHKGIDLDKNDNVIRIQKMYASISYDHRVIDGALASRFVSHFKNLVQNIPNTLDDKG